MNDIQSYFFEKTGKHVSLYNPVNDNCKIRCPYCHDERRHQTDKSLSINIKTGQYKCHNCGKGGVALQKKELKTYKRPEKTHEDITPEALQYMTHDRALPETILANNFVGSGYSNFGGHYVAFNYFLNFRHVNTKYRSISQKHFRMEAGAQLCLYNGDCLKTAKEYAVITEGEFDALSWMAAGYVYAVSVPNGAANNTAYLDVHMDDLEKVETVYIAGDQDAAGYNLALTLADRIGREKCRLIRFPVGIKDSNECFQRYGLDQGKALLRDAFAEAQPFPVEGVESVYDNLDEAYTYLVSGYPETMDIGVPGLSELLSLFPSEVTIFTGAPGAGKSNLVDAVMVHLMDAHSLRIAVVSAEKSVPLHITGLVKKHCKTAIVDKSEAMEALEKLNDHFFYITGDGLYKLDDVLLRTERLVKTRGVKALIIDNLSCIDQSGFSSISDGAASMMAKIKSLAKKYRLIVFLVAHPRKLQEGADGFLLPNGYDILGSSHFYNLTDNIVAIGLRESHVEVATRKVKNMEFVSPLGKLGSRELAFDRSAGGLYRKIYASEMEEQEALRREKENEVFDLF